MNYYSLFLDRFKIGVSLILLSLESKSYVTRYEDS